jgi:cell wall-associated NlpC family hydrolase
VRRETLSRCLILAVVTVLALAGAGPAAAARQLTKLDVLRSARKGQSAPKILSRAFPGTRLVRAQEAPIRVLLLDEAPAIIISGQTDLQLVDDAAPGSPRTLPATHRFEVKRVKGKFQVRDLDDPTSTHVLTGPGIVVDSLGSAEGIRVADPLDRRYRGAMRFFAGRLDTISMANVVDVENYVLGTLPGDMPPAWGAKAPTALRAGAIALRSRALTQRKLPTAPFDFTADDPLYLGLDGERSHTTKAVQSTKNLTLKKGAFPYPASFKYTPAMGSIVFKPRLGTPKMIALGPANAVQGATSAKAAAALQRAMSFIGLPYVWGGSSPAGFDCSGLIWFVFKEQGITLPRVAADQARVGAPVPTIAELLPGDAVFFADSSGYIHHMGLYVGDGKFVHSPHTGDVVKVSDLTTGYYNRQFAGGRRYAPSA